MSRKRQLNVQQDQYRSRGAFVTLEQLFDQRHVAKSIELDYQSRSRLGMSGSHISKHKGRGVDFEEFRAYQPGDDIRQIDWRVTARTGRPFTKVFREERERPVIIGIDQCHNMFFGSQVAFKSVVAAEAAAIICWTTVDNGDRVGGVVRRGPAGRRRRRLEGRLAGGRGPVADRPARVHGGEARDALRLALPVRLTNPGARPRRPCAMHPKVLLK